MHVPSLTSMVLLLNMVKKIKKIKKKKRKWGEGEVEGIGRGRS